jgi:hypothetical protein
MPGRASLARSIEGSDAVPERRRQGGVYPTARWQEDARARSLKRPASKPGQRFRAGIEGRISRAVLRAWCEAIVAEGRRFELWSVPPSSPTT